MGWVGPGQGPQAHLIDQDGSHILGTHFHSTDQFQVFTHGSGRVGQHHVAQGLAHYADRHTVYGPVAPAPEGLSYVTLRPEHDPGARFMPEQQARLAQARQNRPNAPRRNELLDLYYPVSPYWADLVYERDGLRVAVIVVTRDWTLEPFHIAGAGAYCLVLAGGFEDDQHAVLTEGWMRWLEPGTVLEGRSHGGALRLVVLQFPSHGD
jgi:hypothetical protein